MLKICNILPINKIGPEMPRQDVEMYLTHKVLEHKERFAFLADDTPRQHFKILDNSACELGEGMDFKLVLEAAKIIGADEVVLPDIPRSGKSLAKTLEYLVNLPEIMPYKIAAVIQGETKREVLDCATQILAINRIDTIMLPKWYCSMESSNGLGRMDIINTVIDLMQRCTRAGFKPKEIHLLGLDTGIRELITPLAPSIRSVDTGYFAALSTPEWRHLSVAAERPRELKIDLESMDMDMEHFEMLMRKQQKLLDCIKPQTAIIK